MAPSTMCSTSAVYQIERPGLSGDRIELSATLAVGRLLSVKDTRLHWILSKYKEGLPCFYLGGS